MNNNLQKSLEQLRKEVANLPQDDPARERMAQIIRDLEQHLKHPDDAGKTALQGTFSSALEHFEAEHPRLTLLLNQIMNTLSGSGI